MLIFRHSSLPLNFCACVSCRMATNIYRNRHTCDMSRRSFNINSDCCCSSSKTGRTESHFIYALKQFVLKFCVTLVFIVCVNCSECCLFCKLGTSFKCTADTYAYYNRWARVRTCGSYSIKNKFFTPSIPYDGVSILLQTYSHCQSLCRRQ